MAKDVGDGSARSTKVARAQGMVSVQMGCTLDEALLVMRALGRTSSQSVEQIAVGVIDGQIHFRE